MAVCINLPLFITGKDTFARMNYNDDIQSRWWKLEEKLMQRFDKKPDVESILFLIGVQELGDIRKKFSKEQKQDLMHIAVCTLLSQLDYYRFVGRDEDGWPHFEATATIPAINMMEQESLLKACIVHYFGVDE